jgi:hypothetical protein
MAEKTERRYPILTLLRSFFRKLKEALSDLLPIIVVITVFQLAILRQPFPELLEVLMGVALVVIGLMLFVQGLEMGLFPIGEALAVAFARKGSLGWLLIFGFGLGFSTTVAEPALIAITREAAEVAAQGDKEGSSLLLTLIRNLGKLGSFGTVEVLIVEKKRRLRKIVG